MKLPITREFDKLEIACITITSNLAITDINTACGLIFQKEPAQLLGTTLYAVLPKRNSDEFKSALGHLISDSKTSSRFLVLEICGRTFDVRLWKAERTIDEEACFHCIFLDFGLSAQSTHSLHEKSQLIEAMYSASLDAIIIADNEGRVFQWQGKAEEVFGWTENEAVGHYMHDLIIPEKHRLAHIEGMNRFKMTGEVRILNKRIEISALRKSGEEFPVELTISQVKLGGRPYFTSYIRDISERKLNEEQLWKNANLDSLTTLPNRRMFEKQLDYEVKLARRMGFKIGILFIDLDNFKGVNDSFGHHNGDELLKVAAARLSGCIRESDMVARLGGDEFVLLLNTVTDRRALDEVARKIQQELAKPYLISNAQAHVSASVGITIYPDDGDSAEELMNNADQAMYEAKKSGRNTSQHFTKKIKEESITRNVLANSLYTAISNNEFRVAYQPIVNLHTGKVDKAEALLRWEHPKLGNISPVQFIPIAEENGLIVEIGQWLDEITLLQLIKWHKKYGDHFQVSINKSPIQFLRNLNTHKLWIHNLKQNGLQGRNLCIEITENVLLNPQPIVHEKLASYRAAGVEIAIDDFGTGYSSLLYLKEFPIDILKLDRFFISGISQDSKEGILCEAIIAMAHKLGIRVVAEGIEANFQKDFLKNAGCDYGQGYLFSKPLFASDFENFMGSYASRNNPDGH